MVFAPFTDNR